MILISYTKQQLGSRVNVNSTFMNVNMAGLTLLAVTV